MTLLSETLHRQLFGARVRRMLAHAQYDRLEALADSVRRTEACFPSGIPVIASFFGRGFGEVDDEDDPQQWAKLVDGLTTWSVDRPQSATARIALAHGLLARARSTRRLVSDERLRQSEQDLDDADHVLEQCPPQEKTLADWYDTKLRILSEQGADSSYRALSAIARASYPNDFVWYQTMAEHLMPRFYGSPGDWEAFADTCALSLPDSLRDEIYARIVEKQDHYGLNVFTFGKGLSWERVERGLGVWARRCPTSVQPNSALARLAWRSGNRAVAKRAFAAIGDTVEVDIWDDASIFWVAQSWVRSDEKVAALPPTR